MLQVRAGESTGNILIITLISHMLVFHPFDDAVYTWFVKKMVCDLNITYVIAWISCLWSYGQWSSMNREFPQQENITRAFRRTLQRLRRIAVLKIHVKTCAKSIILLNNHIVQYINDQTTIPRKSNNCYQLKGFVVAPETRPLYSNFRANFYFHFQIYSAYKLRTLF